MPKPKSNSSHKLVLGTKEDFLDYTTATLSELAKVGEKFDCQLLTYLMQMALEEAHQLRGSRPTST